MVSAGEIPTLPFVQNRGKVHGSEKKAQQEADDQQIKEYTNGQYNAIMALALVTRRHGSIVPVPNGTERGLIGAPI